MIKKTDNYFINRKKNLIMLFLFKDIMILIYFIMFPHMMDIMISWNLRSLDILDLIPSSKSNDLLSSYSFYHFSALFLLIHIF